MKKQTPKTEVFRSLADFEKEFLPRSFREKEQKKAADVRTIGANLADRSLVKVGVRLGREHK